MESRTFPEYGFRRGPSIPGKPEMLPWAMALTKQRTESHAKDDPEARCLPAGVPRMNPFPWKLVQTPKLLVIEQDITIEDPGAYTKPWNIRRVSALSKDEIQEYICNEDNEDVPHLFGK